MPYTIAATDIVMATATDLASIGSALSAANAAAAVPDD
ncbi:PE family protein [Mycobacterium kansasii 732]|uniref:PE domain-containing protein n=1 Tax=Mycobacterium pseudokansasii TaxID=2341080 RepID=A0A498QUF5_9MYCO|nr:PE family protein [Mycobacterium kansasii 732]VAZ98640.1 hypothetical protein LAUMK35_04075 [Mycobacterium pseudokansasii]VBA29791.1 hypothetical protein LAUMK21_04071 [Mycobacterium pseudokansasii]VBA53257.1 hypothetical protein LAUMK142_03956 [Mycobacterium pseudokansasii]